MRAAVEEAGLAPRSSGEASVANAMVRLLHELDQLEKKKQSVQGMHEARQASAAREARRTLKALPPRRLRSFNRLTRL